MSEIELPPITTRFTLGDEITEVQQAFFDTHGFLIFDRVAAEAEVQMIAEELDAIQASWLEEDRKDVNGIPLFIGEDPDGKPFIQRFCFASTFSERIREFVLDPRFEPVRRMVGADARVGHDEMDGVVVNRYVNTPRSAYPGLGWHTDGLRDLTYFRMPQPMFNVGLHLDRITAADGGLRLIPGSHTQGLWDTCFRKLYFLDHQADPAEVVVETRARRPDRARRPPLAPRGQQPQDGLAEPAAVDVRALPDRPGHPAQCQRPHAHLPPHRAHPAGAQEAARRQQLRRCSGSSRGCGWWSAGCWSRRSAALPWWGLAGCGGGWTRCTRQSCCDGAGCACASVRCRCTRGRTGAWRAWSTGGGPVWRSGGGRWSRGLFPPMWSS